MLRSLYRVYLYGIIIILLYFAAIATTSFLATVLGMTPLSGDNQSVVPASSAIVQSLVFTIIAWLITLGVGGFHYWLVRRDEATDPAANGGVRAFLVNLAEGLAALIALIGGVVGLSLITSGSNTSGAFATLFVFAALFVLFESERRRLPAKSGVALVFQRLHFALLQFIFLLFFVLPTLFNVLTQTFYTALNNLGIINATCSFSYFGVGYCSEEAAVTVSSGQTTALWLTVGLVLLAWLGYWLLARESNRSYLMETFHFLGFATGVIVLLVALNRAIELALRLIQRVPTTGLDFALSYNFVVPLLIGLLVGSVYALWLWHDARRAQQTIRIIRLIALAMAAGLAAVPFWFGWATLLNNLIERAGQNGAAVSLSTSFATMLTGVVYIPLEWWLRADSRRASASVAPRRAFDFALLALGVLTTVISLVTLLYALLTAALGNPLEQWQQSARSSGCSLVVGALVAVLYGWRVLSAQRQPAGQPVTQPTAAPSIAPDAAAPSIAPDAAATAATSESLTPPPASTIEGVLDELLAGRMTRDQAAAHIRALASA